MSEPTNTGGAENRRLYRRGMALEIADAARDLHDFFPPDPKRKPSELATAAAVLLLAAELRAIRDVGGRDGS